MDPRELLAIKRDGGALSADQSAEFLAAYTRGEIADYQAAVLLTSIFIHDMTDVELAGPRAEGFATDGALPRDDALGGAPLAVPLEPRLDDAHAEHVRLLQQLWDTGETYD